MKDTIDLAFKKSAENLLNMSKNEAVKAGVAAAAQIIVHAYKYGGCLYVAGNGGSAADAQHLVAELVVKLKQDRSPIKAFALTTDTSILTAVGNDFGYDLIFSRQVDACMTEKDVLLAITTSGNSPNILEALKKCREKKVKSILLSARDGGNARSFADHLILAPGEATNYIQEAHTVIYHTLCYLIERGLVEIGLCKYK